MDEVGERLSGARARKPGGSASSSGQAPVRLRSARPRHRQQRRGHGGGRRRSRSSVPRWRLVNLGRRRARQRCSGTPRICGHATNRASKSKWPAVTRWTVRLLYNMAQTSTGHHAAQSAPYWLSVQSHCRQPPLRAAPRGQTQSSGARPALGGRRGHARVRRSAACGAQRGGVADQSPLERARNATRAHRWRRSASGGPGGDGGDVTARRGRYHRGPGREDGRSQQHVDDSDVHLQLHHRHVRSCPTRRLSLFGKSLAPVPARVRRCAVSQSAWLAPARRSLLPKFTRRRSSHALICSSHQAVNVVPSTSPPALHAPSPK